MKKTLIFIISLYLFVAIASPPEQVSYVIELIFLSFITFWFSMYVHLNKDSINGVLDIDAPKWYPSCVFCRGVHFGFVIGLMVGYLVWLVVMIL